MQPVLPSAEIELRHGGGKRKGKEARCDQRKGPGASHGRRQARRFCPAADSDGVGRGGIPPATTGPCEAQKLVSAETIGRGGLCT